MRKKVEDLTPREFDVLRELTVGYGNVEIAEKLCITTHTVKAHLTQIYKKLGVTNRTNAIIAINNGKFSLHQDSKRP